MRKRHYIFSSLIFSLSAIVSLCLLQSCHTNSSGSDSAETDNDSYIPSESSEEEDNSASDDEEPVPAPEEPAKPQLHFDTTEEALDYMNTSPDADKYAEGIIPQMAEDELSYAVKLLNNDFDKFLIIDKQLMRVGLFDKYGREILSYRIAGSRNYGSKHKRADNRTPEGFFSVEGIYDSTNWLFTNDNGYTSQKKGQFGPRFIRIKNPVSSQIGLHGTCAPWSIGTRASHGCLRVTNENILELEKYVTPGMPVIISPSERDQAVNEREGYDIPMITMDPYGKYEVSATAVVKKKDSTSKKHTGKAAANKEDDKADTVTSTRSRDSVPEANPPAESEQSEEQHNATTE